LGIQCKHALDLTSPVSLFYYREVPMFLSFNIIVLRLFPIFVLARL
jgi:hypothetical protein